MKIKFKKRSELVSRKVLIICGLLGILDNLVILLTLGSFSSDMQLCFLLMDSGKRYKMRRTK